MSNKLKNINTIKILCLDGDGIGPEIVAASRSIMAAVDKRFNLNLEFQRAEIGLKALEMSGSTFPDDVKDAAKAADGILMGPTSTNDYPPACEGGINPSGFLRKELDLYANIRPARSFAGLPTKINGHIDLVIARENTEGFYSDRSMFLGRAEFMPSEDMALSVRKITRKASTRIAQTAFSLAAKRRRKITVVHKANVFRVSDGLFLESVRAVRDEFPNIEYEEQIVDAMAALLIRDPSQFDVIVTTNMYGDILSDEASEIAGGLGMAASLNAGENFAMAQAQHGSAPTLAGQDIANPSSLILSAAMLFRWIAKRDNAPHFGAAAEAIDNAIATAVKSPRTRTRDLGGVKRSSAYTDKLLAILNK